MEETVMDGHTTSSGVWIAKDFRDNLIIDRHDPMFNSMRAKKIDHLRSANSEDAITWNVFRTLRQIAPAVWLGPLWAAAFGSSLLPVDQDAMIDLWVSTPPPPKLLHSGDEHASEVDVVIQSPTWVWFIEAKYRSDIATRTTTRPDRDQLLRNIDVGSYFAGTRDFYCSLLVTSREQSPEGAKIADAYAKLEEPRRRLSVHRPDGLSNLRAVSLLTWSTLAKVLKSAAASSAREDEKEFAARAVAWLETRGITAL
jgi:hypothetical protein